MILTLGLGCVVRLSGQIGLRVGDNTAVYSQTGIGGGHILPIVGLLWPTYLAFSATYAEI